MWFDKGLSFLGSGELTTSNITRFSNHRGTAVMKCKSGFNKYVSIHYNHHSKYQARYNVDDLSIFLVTMIHQTMKIIYSKWHTLSCEHCSFVHVAKFYLLVCRQSSHLLFPMQINLYSLCLYNGAIVSYNRNLNLHLNFPIKLVTCRFVYSR